MNRRASPVWLPGVNVLEAAQVRMKFIFDNFDPVMVQCSGGKDSIALLELALAEARRRKRLPLDVLFNDQECEWRGTIEYIRRLQARPEVKLHWLQLPYWAGSIGGEGFRRSYVVWGERERDIWMRPQESESVKAEDFALGWEWLERYRGKDEDIVAYQAREVADAYLEVTWPDGGMGFMLGLRIEESQTRHLTLTMARELKHSYKWVTWASKFDHESGARDYRLNPIYDWRHGDVWRYIHDIGADYNEVYDKMFQLGLSWTDLRVSGLSHMEAASSLQYVAEIEPDTWDALCRRSPNLHAGGVLDKFGMVYELPEAFSSWLEYRDYLFHSLHTTLNQKGHHAIKMLNSKYDALYIGTPWETSWLKQCVKSILANDFYGKLLETYAISNQPYKVEQWRLRKAQEAVQQAQRQLQEVGSGNSG